MKRTWHNPMYAAPQEIDCPEQLEDLGYDVYSKSDDVICAVSGMLIVAEYRVDAYEQLTEDEQKELFEIMRDEAADNSSRDMAFMLIEQMSLAEMREILDGDE